MTKAVEISDRILAMIQHLDVSLNRFATKTEVHYNTYRLIIDGKTKTISDETVQKIIKAYPIFDGNWIKSGVGTILKASTVDYDKILAEKDKEIKLLNEALSLYRKLEKIRENN